MNGDEMERTQIDCNGIDSWVLIHIQNHRTIKENTR